MRRIFATYTPKKSHLEDGHLVYTLEDDLEKKEKVEILEVTPLTVIFISEGGHLKKDRLERFSIVTVSSEAPNA